MAVIPARKRLQDGTIHNAHLARDADRVQDVEGAVPQPGQVPVLVTTNKLHGEVQVAHGVGGAPGQDHPGVGRAQGGGPVRLDHGPQDGAPAGDLDEGREERGVDQLWGYVSRCSGRGGCVN